MKKICIFSAQYLPHLGGVERYTYNLATELYKQGNQIVIVTSNVGGLKTYEKKDGIEIYRIPCFSLMNGRYPFLKPDKTFRKIHRHLLKTKFDLILINTRFYPHSVYGTILARKQKTHCIMVDHGTSHMTVHNPIGDFVEQSVEHFLTMLDKINCKEYYGVSEACTEWLKHFHIKAKGVLYNAIDLNKIEEIKAESGDNYRKKYNIPEDGIVVSFTGRLLKEKGILQLIEGIKQLREEGHPVYLLIAGDGDEEKTIQAKADEGIIPLGRLEFEKIITMLQQTDIFCLPSDSEGFSTSVLEAAACNCYVITTERGGSKEMLISKDYGMIIKDNDTETVKKALEDVIYKKEYREKATRNTYERLKQNYTWEIVAKQVYNIACQIE
ncbi:glycosyltransferase family 1 protein [Blautia sp. TF11-31AT]|nr:glycosyltransferase family 1 protein [Blautia sp. TF11-31AT]